MTQTNKDRDTIWDIWIFFICSLLCEFGYYCMLLFWGKTAYQTTF